MAPARLSNGADELIVAIADGEPGPPVSKMEAHRDPGVLHLAVSVQLVDPDGRWLLQRRAASKAAFANRWANSCCTHPMPGEDPAAAATRRVQHELGLAVTDLVPAGDFTYRALDEQSGLVEHERDLVFVVVMDTSAAAAEPAEISELARLPYPEALSLVTSNTGAPWATTVLRLSVEALQALGLTPA